jgi:hypothetical protein
VAPSPSLPQPGSGTWRVDASREYFGGIDSRGDDAVAVSDQGTYRYVDSEWIRVAAGVSQVTGVSLAKDGTVYVLSVRALYRLDDTGWTIQLQGNGYGFLGICGFGENSLAVIGGTYLNKISTSFLYEFDGVSWSYHSLPDGLDPTSVWCSSANSLYVTGGNGELFRFDGVGWTRLAGGADFWLLGVSGRSDDDVVAVGDRGTIIHYDGSTWQRIDTGTGVIFRGAHESPGGNLYVWGDAGTCFRYDGVSWTPVPVAAEYINGMADVGTAGLFVTTTNAMLWNGGREWRRVAGGPSVYLNSVWAAPEGEAFAVGRYHTIEKRRADGWNPEMGGGTRDEWRAVWGRSSTDVYVVGTNGKVVHYDGSAWTAMESGTTQGLFGVWGGVDYVVAVGNSVALYNDGSGWTQMPGDLPTPSLRDVWSASKDDIFAVGDLGAIAHYDGTAWAVAQTSATADMRGVWGTSGDDVFAVGHVSPFYGPTRYWAGTVMHYDGSQWTRLESESAVVNFESVWGTSDDRILGAGEASVARFDGNDWNVVSLWPASLRDLHGDTERAYAVGATRIFAYDLEQ